MANAAQLSVKSPEHDEHRKSMKNNVPGEGFMQGGAALACVGACCVMI